MIKNKGCIRLGESILKTLKGKLNLKQNVNVVTFNS